MATKKPLALYNGEIKQLQAGDVIESTSDTHFNNNIIINGDFALNQRGVTSLVSTAGYPADRWYSAGELSLSTVVNNTSTDINVIGGSKHLELTVANTTILSNSYGFTVQYIENVKLFLGKTVTISFWAKHNSTGVKQMATDFTQMFGTGTGVTGMKTGLGATVYSVTDTLQKFTSTITLPNADGVTFTTNGDFTTYLRAYIWVRAGSDFTSRFGGVIDNQNITFSISNVKLEYGNNSTPFYYRSLSEELILAKRYYYKNTLIYRESAFTSTAQSLRDFPYAVAMRTTPTAILTNNGSVGVDTGTATMYTGTTSSQFGITQTTNNAYINYFVALNAEFI